MTRPCISSTWPGGSLDLDPTEVFAAGSTLAEPRLAEYGDVYILAVTLKLPSGALVQIDCTRRTGYGYDERIEVLGSTGMVQAQRHRTGAVSRYHAGKVVEKTACIPDGSSASSRPTLPRWLSFRRLLWRTVPPITPSLRDGLKAQAIAEAATRSLSSGAQRADQLLITQEAAPARPATPTWLPTSSDSPYPEQQPVLCREASEREYFKGTTVAPPSAQDEELTFWLLSIEHRPVPGLRDRWAESLGRSRHSLPVPLYGRSD